MDRTEILDLISDGVIFVDSAWRYTYVNRRAGEILGVDVDELVGHYLWDEFPEGPEQPFYDACSQAVTTREPTHTEAYHAELDLWFDHHVYPTASGLSIVFQDITARRSAEDAVERQREVVDAVEARQPLTAALTILTRSFERGLPGALCSIVLLDDDGVHLRTGAAPSLPDEYNAAIDGVAIGPKVGSCGTAAFLKTPVFVNDIDTDPLWADFCDLARRFGLRACWSSPILGADGVVLGTFAIYRRAPRVPSLRERALINDAARLAQMVIERRRAEALQQKTDARLLAELQQAQRMEAVGRLAGGIAHDFNNLLTVIQANTDFTLEDLPDDHPSVANLQEVLGAADRAAQLTRQLLAFSRKQVLVPTQLDLDVVLNEAGAHLGGLLAPGIDLVIAPAGESIGARADRAQLQQVLTNLVTNARDALASGGTITLATGRERVGSDIVWENEPVPAGEYARIAVHDDGVGMDEATIVRIFEPFFTTKAFGSGTGLGLAMVHGIVRQSGGWIRVVSEPGRGTTVSVLLPFVPGRPPSGSKEAATRASLRGTELVLLVEDEPLVRTSTRRVLERLGYRVIEARHGAEALGLWEAQRSDIALVLTDVMMPELGGPELALRLRALEPSVRIVFMSGYVGDDAVSESSPLSTREPFIQKPFSADVLAREVRSALDAPPREKA